MNIPRSVLMVIAIGIIVMGVMYVLRDKNNSNRSLNKQNPFDTLNYGEEDYTLMINHFNSDTAFLSTLNRKIEQGDTNAIQVKELLRTPYSKLKTLGLEESEIDAMMYSYYLSKDLVGKFDKINERLLKETSAKTNPDSVLDMYLDSVRNLMEDKTN